MAKKPPRRSRLDAARARMYRDLVFESAEHVFARKSFEAATMQEIAGEAGISLKTLYATSPGKQELYAEISRVRGMEFAETVAAAQDVSGDALEKLAAGVRAYVDFLVHHPDYLRIHLREGRTWGLAPDEAWARDSWSLGVGATAAIVREGQEAGVFYPGDAELMAMRSIAVMQVEIAHHADGVGPDDAGRMAEDVLTQLRRLLCRPGVEDKGRAAA